jgi:hypothetical protein
MTSENTKTDRWKAVRVSAGVFILAALIADELARPFYRPLLEAAARLDVMKRFSSWVSGLPRAAILVLFAVPFAIAEPLKVLALVLIAKGNAVLGLILLIFSYLTTFLIVERIYHAGRDKLLTFGWFAAVAGQVSAVRDFAASFKRAAVTRARGWLGAEA